MEKKSSAYGWVVTFSGTGINLALGALYAWSVFKKPLESAYGLNDKQSALPYSVAIIIFAVAMVLAGKMQDRLGPRIVATVGGALVFLGFLLSSFAVPGNALTFLVVGFGVLAGTGIGFGYASATPPAVKWFPPIKKGLITGLVVGGFGLASVYVAPMTTALINSKAPAAVKATAPEEAARAAERTRVLLVELKAEGIAKSENIEMAAAREEAAPLVAAEEKAKADAKAKSTVKPSLGEQMARLKAYIADPAAAKATAAEKKAKAVEAVKAGFVLTRAGEIAAAEGIPMSEAVIKAAPAVSEEMDAKAKEDARKYISAASFAFRTLAIIFGIMVLVFAQFLKNPPAGYKPTAAAPVAAKKNGNAPTQGVDYTVSEMLKTPQFYLIWIMFVFGSGAGLMVISFIGKLAKELYDAKIIALAGFVFVAILAIGNASGRIIAGFLSDKIGRARAMFLVFIIQAVVLSLFPKFNNTGAFVIGALIIGFDYGACLSLFPSITSDYYGLKNFGFNYGVVFTAWGVGGFIMPTYIAGVINVATGFYDLSFYVAAILCVAAAAITFLVKPPAVKNRVSGVG
jgi:nitrate/nitrite transporter NarK